jgi:hypothetical protein
MIRAKGDRGVQAYYYAGQQELVGQGVLDVSKAVRGPGALNARRLTKADLSTDYTVSREYNQPGFVSSGYGRV